MRTPPTGILPTVTKLGRPPRAEPTGSRVKFSVTLPRELLARIDESAAANYRDRTREVQWLLEVAFNTLRDTDKDSG